MSAYVATIEWRRGAQESFVDGRYSRAHRWTFDGGHVAPATASPYVVRAPLSDPAGVDPEEALVAAQSSCHMLFFLDFARRGGFVVDSYVDAAEGVMDKVDGRIQMTRVTLKPHIVFSGATRPTAADVDAMHHSAHDACYIANSTKSEIRIEGQCEGLAG